MKVDFQYSLTELQSRFGSALYAKSFVAQEGATLWLMQTPRGKQLAVLGEAATPVLGNFEGDSESFEDNLILTLCSLSLPNARALRELLPWLKPVPLGLSTSAGFGDRLGLATPGHIRALRAAEHLGGRTIAPIFAQQSIREMTRTNRSPEDVLTDATWGAFEAGWHSRLGADADHLKTPDDIDRCVAAGFSFFTIDPGAYVDSAADSAAPDVIAERARALPWAMLESSPRDLETRYAGRSIECDGLQMTLEYESILRAAVKYGRAIAHVVTLYRHLTTKNVPFELEVSVDETETPTTHAEHIYIASELRRLAVQWVSLAPRFVGRFEKGVDYIGELPALAADLRVHAAVARALGPYKLSLHSGSDKFSVYRVIVPATDGQVHLKTAGTSYLEALRAIAPLNPSLFREILELGRERYSADRATYHVSAEVDRVPASPALTDAQLPALLNDFHARQVLHVTFGSALAKFGEDLKATLRAHAAEHYAALEKHFLKHLTPFVTG